MIYELCVVQKGDASEAEVAKAAELVRTSISGFNGEVLVEDNWGVKTLAQATSTGKATGNYTYFIYKAETGANQEINRRLLIDESVMKFGLFKLDEKLDVATVVKTYKTPFSKKHNGSVLDELEESSGESAKDRRRFSRGKSCWFKANGVTADWKEPQTYNWLVNEFGKISAARVTGISRKHQRFVNTAIKRARNLGVLSHISSRTLG